jgi:hypothetical protein
MAASTRTKGAAMKSVITDIEVFVTVAVLAYFAVGVVATTVLFA